MRRGVQARGGGATGVGSIDVPTSSASTIRPQHAVDRSTHTTAGAGSEVVAADQPARMPPQASIDFSEIPGPATTSLGRSSAGCCGAAAAVASQHDGAAADAAQHVGASSADEQHEGVAGAGRAPAARAPRAMSVDGSRPRASAQARSSAGVLQQQLEKHCSAVAHPHGLSMQGKGRERSLSASRLAAREPVAASDPAKGSGTPETTST